MKRNVVFPCKLVSSGVDFLPGIGSQFFCDSAFSGVGAAHGVVLIKTMVAVGTFGDLHGVHEGPGTALYEKGDVSAVICMIVGHKDVEIPIVDGKLF